MIFILHAHDQRVLRVALVVEVLRELYVGYVLVRFQPGNVESERTCRGDVKSALETSDSPEGIPFIGLLRCTRDQLEQKFIAAVQYSF